MCRGARPSRSQMIGGHYDTVAHCILEQLEATGRVWLMGASFAEDQTAQRARISKRSAPQARVRLRKRLPEGEWSE